MTPDPYAVLGVRPNASAAEIRDAYRRRAKTSHPDAGGSADAFDRVTLAYDLLADPGRRFAYDRSAARRDAAGASVHEHRVFEDLTQPTGRPANRRDRHSRTGNLAVSLVGGAALVVAAVVAREFGGSSAPAPPTPVSCLAVRTVSATYVLLRRAEGTAVAVQPRVTLRNAGSDLAGVSVAFVVTVTVTGGAAARRVIFGRHDPAIWARRGAAVTSELTTAAAPDAILPTAERIASVRAVATARTVTAAATALPAEGCAIRVTPGG